MFADDVCVNTHTQNSMCIVRVMNLERTEFLESVLAKSNSGNLHTLQIHEYICVWVDGAPPGPGRTAERTCNSDSAVQHKLVGVRARPGK